MIAIFLFVASPKPSEDFATKWTLPQNKQKTKQNWGARGSRKQNSMQLHQYSGSRFSVVRRVAHCKVFYHQYMAGER